MKNRRIIYIVFMMMPIFFLCFPRMGIADYPDGDYTVSHVISGDTFVLADGTRVRLIGIDAPDAGELCFEQAAQRLTSLISNKTVSLEKDISEKDTSNNLLRYVHVGETFVNLILVSEGYAWAVTNLPDIKYDSLLTGAEQNARSTYKGCLWSFFIPDDDTKGYLEVSCFIHCLMKESFVSVTF